jgi:hypothetical protein
MDIMRDDGIYVQMAAVMMRNTSWESPIGICSNRDLKFE